MSLSFKPCEVTLTTKASGMVMIPWSVLSMDGMITPTSAPFPQNSRILAKHLATIENL